MSKTVFVMDDRQEVDIIMATSIRSFNRLVLCLASILCIFTQQSSAKILDVGGALGWTDFDTAISAAPNYDIWSSEHTINVGDVLGQYLSLSNLKLLPDQLQELETSMKQNIMFMVPQCFTIGIYWSSISHIQV
jgi:hypothetical protein